MYACGDASCLERGHQRGHRARPFTHRIRADGRLPVTVRALPNLDGTDTKRPPSITQPIVAFHSLLHIMPGDLHCLTSNFHPELIGFVPEDPSTIYGASDNRTGPIAVVYFAL